MILKQLKIQIMKVLDFQQIVLNAIILYEQVWTPDISIMIFSTYLRT